MYLNLNNGGGPNLSAARPGFGAVGRNVTQNWVIISMFAEGRFSVDFDSAWLGNGCSAPVPVGATVGPVGGVLVCPAGVTCTPAGSFTGTNVTP